MKPKSISEMLGERVIASPPVSRQRAERDVMTDPDSGGEQGASIFLRLAYCLVLLAAVVPSGVVRSGWVALATGGKAVGLAQSIGSFILLLLALYRMYGVARERSVLNSPRATGLIAFFRSIGMLCIYFGVLITILSWTARPLMQVFLTHRSENGVEFFIAGMFLWFISGVGIFGVFLFESSRLLAFERRAAQAGT